MRYVFFATSLLFAKYLLTCFFTCLANGVDLTIINLKMKAVPAKFSLGSKALSTGSF